VAPHDPYRAMAAEQLEASRGTPGWNERVKSLAGRLLAEDERKGIVRFTAANWGMDY
jgi:hypothetical protein